MKFARYVALLVPLLALLMLPVLNVCQVPDDQQTVVLNEPGGGGVDANSYENIAQPAPIRLDVARSPPPERPGLPRADRGVSLSGRVHATGDVRARDRPGAPRRRLPLQARIASLDPIVRQVTEVGARAKILSRAVEEGAAPALPRATGSPPAVEQVRERIGNGLDDAFPPAACDQ